jgi:hypothetical protein
LAVHGQQNLLLSTTLQGNLPYVIVVEGTINARASVAELGKTVAAEPGLLWDACMNARAPIMSVCLRDRCGAAYREGTRFVVSRDFEENRTF